MFLRLLRQAYLVYLSFVNAENVRLGPRLTALIDTVFRIWQVRKRRESTFTSSPTNRTTRNPMNDPKSTPEKPTRKNTRPSIRKPGKRG